MHHAFGTLIEWIPWEIFFEKAFPTKFSQDKCYFQSHMKSMESVQASFHINSLCLVSDFDWMASILKSLKVDEIVRSIGLFISRSTATRI